MPTLKISYTLYSKKLSSVNVSEIWEYNANKIKLLNNTGYNTYIIWEHDYKVNKEESLEKIVIVNFIKENINDK